MLADIIRSPLELAPIGKSVSLLVRHSIRFPIIFPEDTWTAGLTPEGFQLAEEFGAWLAQTRHIFRVRTSPIGRCVDTGMAVSRGADISTPVVIDEKLGFPYIEKVWIDVNTQPIPEEPPQEALDILSFLLEGLEQDPGLSLNITHDGNIAFMAITLLGEPIIEENWPDFLEGIAFWREQDAVHIAWRGKVHEFRNQAALAYDLVEESSL